MKTIPLSKGFVAQVSDEDYETLAAHCWTAAVGKYTVYAVRSVKAAHTVTGRTLVKMHRQIMQAADGEVVDHKDRDGLNNCRTNLRRCGQPGNVANGIRRTNNTSGYKGVSWARGSRKWAASLRKNYVRRHLGLFVDPADAARAYDAAALEAFGEFARLNFPVIDKAL